MNNYHMKWLLGTTIVGNEEYTKPLEIVYN